MLMFLEVMFLVVGLLALGHLVFLGLVAGFLPRRKHEPTGAEIAALIPAHNEGASLGAILDDLHGQTEPPCCVLVVADGCTDNTADVARSHGAAVLELGPAPGGKPAALAMGLDHLYRVPWDAVLVVDADCRVAPDFLARASIDRDAVAQCAVCLRAADRGLAFDFASRLENRLFHAGRSRLGLPAFLRGTGMLLGRDALDARPWTAAGLTEDRQQGLAFLAAGIPVRYAQDLEVESGVPRDWDDAWQQRRRWTSNHVLHGLLAGMRVLPGAVRSFGVRALELPMAVLSDARASWLLSLLLASVLDLWLGGPFRILIGVAWIVVLLGSLSLGFAWYGVRFPRLLLELPAAVLVSVGSAALATVGRRPARWLRGRRDS